MTLHSVLRTTTAAVLAAAAFATASPGVAHANAGDFSVKVTVENNTKESFDLLKYDVTEGDSTTEPNQTIAPSKSDFFKTESNWDQGGTAGSIKYQLTNGGYVVIYWSNPYEETNWYDCKVPNYMTCSWSEDQDYHAEMTFSISD
ncbi:hypothetical protein [Actinoplanes sp. GCM10030250]|uniref:hypothetical protein n=1 Tax=Actinoplanes sp. GCM10030250 TaxID=3273376 RepID=UPI003606E406